MNGLVFLYFPLGCLLIGIFGAMVLRHTSHEGGASLELCRAILLGFPFALMGSLLLKPYGPSFWMNWAYPHPARAILLLALIGLVALRWIGEMIAAQALQWRVEGPDIERPAREDFLEAIDFNSLAARLAPAGPLAMIPTPKVFMSKATGAGHLTSGFRPRICIDASLVPDCFRDDDLWWQSVLTAPEILANSLDPLKAVVAHELGHFKRGDHLRTFFIFFAGLLLPWEWLVSELSLEKFFLTNNWLFKRWSGLMRILGWPVRVWIAEDHHLRERLADEDATQAVPEGWNHLVAVRALYPSHTDLVPPDTRRKFPALFRVAFVGLAGILLWASPGRIPFKSTFGRGIPSTPLPCGWCLTLEGRSVATAAFLPEAKRVGCVLVDCHEVEPGHSPELRAIGRQDPRLIPAPCEVEMKWLVHYIGPQPMGGREAVMSLTQSSQMAGDNMDLVAAYSLPEGPVATLPGGWTEYVVRTRVSADSRMDILYLCFRMPHPGRYVFRPPELALILPGGERRPYPGDGGLGVPSSSLQEHVQASL